MTDREETQDAPVMDGATNADEQEKNDGARELRAADAKVVDEALPTEDLKDDLRSIRGYGEDR